MAERRFLVFPQGRKMNFNIFLLAFITIALLISLTACSQAVVTFAPTIGPTETSLPTATPAATLQPGESQHSLMVNGLERKYLLHIPPDLDSSRLAPVVFALHGYDSETFFEISGLQNMAGFGDISDKNGFILVYPMGVSGFWNVGGGCCGTSFENNVDEISFIRQILADLRSIANVDPKRVYAAGFSMGGMLAFRLACEMSDTIAAVAPVAGSFLYEPCKPSQPVSIMQVHGKKDTSVPYDGGVGGFITGNINFPPVEKSLAAWASMNGCSGSPTTDQQGVALHTLYSGCNGGSSVELYTIDVMGHNWPSQYVLPVSQMIWDFFKAHPKQ